MAAGREGDLGLGERTEGACLGQHGVGSGSVLPASEGLETDCASGGELDDGLKVRSEGTGLEEHVQVAAPGRSGRLLGQGTRKEASGEVGELDRSRKSVCSGSLRVRAFELDQHQGAEETGVGHDWRKSDDEA